MSQQIPLNIAKLVEEVYHLHSFPAAQKGLRFTYSTSPKISKVIGDPVSLKRDLSAMLSAAIEQTESGIVEVVVDKVRSTANSMIVRFKVSCTGNSPLYFETELPLNARGPGRKTA